MPTGKYHFIKNIFLVFRMPIYCAATNFLFVNTVYLFLPNGIGDYLYNIVRIVIIGYAGRLVIREKLGGLFCAAMAGVLIYFIEHVVLNIDLWLIRYIFSLKDLKAISLSGILVSFLIFIPLTMLFATIGGLSAHVMREKTTTT